MVDFCRAVAIGDTHLPFHSQYAQKELLKFVRSEKPDLVIQIGDLYDQYAFSRYGRSLNHGTPNEELERGRAAAEKMWKDLRQAAPGARCVQLLGNHDVRLRKRVAEKLPEASGMLDDSHLFDFDGVLTAKNDRDPVPVRICGEKVMLHHGFLSKTGDHVRYFRENVIIGHTHRPQTHYERMGSKVLWELNCGFMGDAKRHVFGYGAAPHRWALGFGYVDENGPRVIGL